MTENKDKLFELQFVDKQLGQLKEHLEKLDQQLNEVMGISKSLEEFKELDGKEELLVPIVSGIFASARLESSQQVKMNVGQGIVVEKNIDQTIAMIGDQTAQMVQYREQVLEQFNSLIKRAETLAGELQKTQ